MKKILVALTLLTLTAVALWGFGFWNPDSAIYWRRPAQTALLVNGRFLPRFLARRVTHLALRTHVEGSSAMEIQYAADIFKRIGDNKNAALLERTLSREAVLKSEFDKAIAHAKSSYQLDPNKAVVIDLVPLTIRQPEATEWITQLQKVDPDHELSQATLCRSQLESFENEIPASCRRVQWVSETAESGQSEYNELVKEIEDLPAKRREKIAEYEADIALQEGKRSQYLAEIEDIERQKSEATASAAVEIGVDLLPLPKPGDTLGSWVAREGFCLLPYVRVFCAVNSASGPLARLKQRIDGLNELRRLTEVVIGYNNQAIKLNREMITYWESDQPLEELKRKKDNVLPKFGNNIADTIWSRKETTGLTLSEAISQMPL